MMVSEYAGFDDIGQEGGAAPAPAPAAPAAGRGLVQQIMSAFGVKSSAEASELLKKFGERYVKKAVADRSGGGGGGGYTPPPEGYISRTSEPPSKPFPWIPVAAAVAGVGVLAAVFLLTGKKGT